MRRLRLLALAPVAAALAACLGPTPPLPPDAAPEVPAAFRFAPVPAPAPVDLQWWRSFGDPGLSAVVEEALLHNPDVGEAIQRVEQARAEEREARANRGPEIDGENVGGRTRSIGPPVATTAFAEPEAVAVFDLDLFGKLRQADRAAQASLLSSAATRDAVELATASTAASAYITLLSLDARLDIVHQAIALRTVFLNTARHRAQVGYTSALELRQAQAEYDSVAALLPSTELSVAQAEDALSILIGHPPAAVLRAPGGLQALVIPAVPGGLPSRLLARRPDVYAAEEAVVSADHSLKSARANMLPDFTLTGSVGEEFAQVLPHGEVEYLIANSVIGPLFDSGRRRAAADVVAAERNEAAFAYKSAVLGALRDVDDSLVAIQRDREQDGWLVAQAQVEARTLDLARRRYRAGYTPYFDQIDAERQLLLAQLDVVQARAAWLSAYVTLYQALGGGWRVEDVATPPTRPTPTRPTSARIGR